MPPLDERLWGLKITRQVSMKSKTKRAEKPKKLEEKATEVHKMNVSNSMVRRHQNRDGHRSVGGKTLKSQNSGGERGRGGRSGGKLG